VKPVEEVEDKSKPQRGGSQNKASAYEIVTRSLEAPEPRSRLLLRTVRLRLDQAFITPLDREDILSLITEMYGVVDRVSELSQRFRLYKLRDLHPTFEKIVEFP
jgi:uncharacterized protein Yka (UPF0111/DUF47 family)